MRHLTISLAVFAALTLLAPFWASAQEDTTPPVLLDFTMGPAAFDSGLSVVNLDWCAEVQDDLSGVLRVNVNLCHETEGFIAAGGDNPVGLPLHATVCGVIPISQFSPYGDYFVFVSPVDDIRNGRTYVDPAVPSRCGAGDEDLCPIGTCRLLNRPASGLPDGDNDGVPDDADNCPDDPNADQADADLDLIGDVCDPFPDDRDNEKAQCFDDLASCESVPAFVDSDGDGEEDSTDACPGTLIAMPVDGNGCSLPQFCTAIEVNSRISAHVCKRSDWRNDEPITKPNDCVVDRQVQPPVCVPVQ